MNYYGKGYANHGEFSNDCCHLTSSSRTLRSKGYVIIKINKKVFLYFKNLLFELY